MKSFFPWWAKIAGKVVLSRLPVSGRTWQQLGLFVPGSMLDPDYVISVYNQHFSNLHAMCDDIHYLEFGPGDSLATCIIAWAHGASGGYLVDNGAYASEDIRCYYPLIKNLMSIGSRRDISCLMDCKNVEEIVSATNCRYMQGGLESLKSIEDECVDLVFSQAVLEHVRLAEFFDVTKELYRIQKISGIGSHRIDFKDHLGGSLNSLRFSTDLWEKDWFAFRSGFYTNRIRFSQVLSQFESAGFIVEVAEREMWDQLPLRKDRISRDFINIEDTDLLTKGANIIVRKPLGINEKDSL